MVIFSSKTEETNFDLSTLSLEELELISALLYNVTLGNNVSPYRDAAFTLMGKIENFIPNPDFMQDAATNVQVEIKILDDDGNHITMVDNDHFEISV